MTDEGGYSFLSDLVSNEVDNTLTHYAFNCGVGVQLTFIAQKKVHRVYVKET